MSPSCPRESEWKPWIDGEVDAHRAVELREHLERCGPCAEIVATFRRLGELVRRAPLAVPPIADVRAWSDTVVARAVAARRDVERTIHWLQGACAVAAALLVCAALLHLWAPDTHSFERVEGVAAASYFGNDAQRAAADPEYAYHAEGADEVYLGVVGSFDSARIPSFDE